MTSFMTSVLRALTSRLRCFSDITHMHMHPHPPTHRDTPTHVRRPTQPHTNAHSPIQRYTTSHTEAHLHPPTHTHTHTHTTLHFHKWMARRKFDWIILSRLLLRFRNWLPLTPTFFHYLLKLTWPTSALISNLHWNVLNTEKILCDTISYVYGDNNIIHGLRCKKETVAIVSHTVFPHHEGQRTVHRQGQFWAILYISHWECPRPKARDADRTFIGRERKIPDYHPNPLRLFIA